MNTRSQHTSIRIPAELRDALTSIAEIEGRSLNALIVDLLQERVENLRIISAAVKGDLLGTAHYAAQAAELYARAARGAIRRLKNQETDGLEFLEESPITSVGKPHVQMLPILKELLEEVSTLDADEQAALLTLIGKRK